MRDPETHLGKNSLRNDYLFLSKIYTDKAFRCDLLKIFDKWPSSYREKSLGYHREYRDLKKIKENNALAYKQRVKFIEDLDKEDRVSDFYNDINSLINKYDFGREWFLTVTDFIISDWFYPPHENLNVNEDNKRVVLTLNPDTSLDDIEAIWPTIKEKQKKLWPNYKKTNFSKKMFKNLQVAIRDKEEKKASGGVETDNVSNLQKYKISDLDLVSKIWKYEGSEDDAPLESEEADRKKVVNLRQIRKRFRDKIA